MTTQNGTTDSGSDHHLLEHQLEALKAGLRKLIDRANTGPTGEPTRLRSYADRATETIQEHPFAAIAIALGLGYVTTRIARRPR